MMFPYPQCLVHSPTAPSLPGELRIGIGLWLGIGLRINRDTDRVVHVKKTPWEASSWTARTLEYRF